MEVKGLKTCEDVISYVSYLEKKYGKIEKELKDFKIGLFSADKAKLKAKRARMEEELERISDTYDRYDRIFKETTTFTRGDLSVFLAKYFSLLKGKTFEVQRGVRDISDSKYAKTCDFIASSDDFERIDKKFDLNKPVCLDDVINICRDDCLSLGGTRIHTLLEDSALNSDFSAFPEIIDVAKNLITVKLSYPDLTDSERLDFILKELTVANEIKFQESQLGRSVSSELEEAKKLTAPLQSSQPSALDSSFQSNVFPVIASPVVAPKPSRSDDMESAILKSILSMQSTIVEDECPFVIPTEEHPAQPVIKPESTPSSSDKKLTKSMMERYMRR